MKSGDLVDGGCPSSSTRLRKSKFASFPEDDALSRRKETVDAHLLSANQRGRMPLDFSSEPRIDIG
jgi:hypothetical protein